MEMPKFGSVKTPTISIFTKPSRAQWRTGFVSLVLFAGALLAVEQLLHLPAPTMVALFVAGFCVGLADFLGASAKRLGNVMHAFIVVGFYCGIWITVLPLDWLFFDRHGMAWMGW